MAVKSQHLTPHVLVTTPRRCDGSPHSDASAILFSVNTYSLESNSNTERFHILDAATGESSLVTDVDGIREASWIDDDTIVTFRAGKDGAVEVGIGNANDFDKRWVGWRYLERIAPPGLVWSR